MRGLSPCLGRALGIAALSGSLGLASLGIAGCRTEVVVEERHRPPPHHETVVVEEQPVVEVRVREAPPVARVEVRAACPGPAHEYHWIEGHWQWDGHRWVWYGGHWHRIPPAKHAYVSGVWRVHGDGGYIWVAGHWD